MKNLLYILVCRLGNRKPWPFKQKYIVRTNTFVSVGDEEAEGLLTLRHRPLDHSLSQYKEDKSKGVQTGNNALSIPATILFNLDAIGSQRDMALAQLSRKIRRSHEIGEKRLSSPSLVSFQSSIKQKIIRLIGTHCSRPRGITVDLFYNATALIFVRRGLFLPIRPWRECHDRSSQPNPPE